MYLATVAQKNAKGMKEECGGGGRLIKKGGELSGFFRKFFEGGGNR